MSPFSPKTRLLHAPALLARLLICASLMLPSLARLVAINEQIPGVSYVVVDVASSPQPVPRLLDFRASLTEVVANHVPSPESAPSPSSSSEPLLPVVAISVDDMPHPVTDSRFVNGIMRIVHSNLDQIERELSDTSPSGAANLCEHEADGFHVYPTASPPCSSFFTCHAGNMSGPTPCPKGKLFDHHTKLCGPATYVRCATSALAPGGAPLRKPRHHHGGHHPWGRGRHHKHHPLPPPTSNLLLHNLPGPVPITAAHLNATACATEDQSVCSYCNLVTYAPKKASSGAGVGGIVSYNAMCRNLTAIFQSSTAAVMTEVVANVYDLCVVLQMGDYALSLFRHFAARISTCTAKASVSFEAADRCLKDEQKLLCAPKKRELLKSMSLTIASGQGYGYHSAAASCTWKSASARFATAAKQFEYYCNAHFLVG